MAFLPPHAAAEWSACHQWATMRQQFPDMRDRSGRDEGIRAHERLFALMHGEAAPHDDLGDDLLEAVDMAHAWAVQQPVKWEVEPRLETGVIHPENWGYPDLLGWEGMTLHVVEFKSGHGYVEHVGNLPLVNYALHELKRRDVHDLQVDVCLTVIQPRCYRAEPIRSWRVPATDLRGYANQLREAAERSTRADRQATTGPQCLHCPGRHACDTLASAAGNVIRLVSKPSTTEVTPAALGLELSVVNEAQTLLDALKTGLEQQVTHHLKSGNQVPGWEFTADAGRERWSANAGTVSEMAAAFGVDISKPGVLTPNQARKKGLPDEVIRMMSARESGAPKLRKSDPLRAAEKFRK